MLGRKRYELTEKIWHHWHADKSRDFKQIKKRYQQHVKRKELRESIGDFPRSLL